MQNCKEPIDSTSRDSFIYTQLGFPGYVTRFAGCICQDVDNVSRACLLKSDDPTCHNTAEITTHNSVNIEKW